MAMRRFMHLLKPLLALQLHLPRTLLLPSKPCSPGFVPAPQFTAALCFVGPEQ
jgi:hypothetical protein